MSCKHYERALTENDRYYVDSDNTNNCVFCLIDQNGAMTQDQVAGFFRRLQDENMSD